MVLASSDVTAGDDILDSDHNDLREDLRDQDCDIQTRYYAVSPYDFHPWREDQLWEIISGQINPHHATTAGTYIAGVHLPHGAIVTSFKVFWDRDDAAASGVISLLLTNNVGGGGILATADSDASSGFHTVEDTSINNATIDNSINSYGIEMTLDPNNLATEIRFMGAIIKYTIVKGLP